MAYMALYRKYRPSTFDDFIDQDNVKKILINSIENNKISHAYLFSGPRGIGKTSMAKIFAKAINCECFNEKNDVCDKCNNCVECNDQSVDIVEIDAASNNGVDQIRDLKSKISIVPSKLKYKVYIIDEVHMLTNSAFNALLKTLEEPPAHVVFILATTEFYEVPETIVSRCQCFSFRRISLDSLIKRLKYIAEKEDIDIEEDAIKDIAYYSNGGLRDAIGMLDKLNSFSNSRITSETFRMINGMISQQDIVKCYEYILKNNVDEVLKIIENVENQGYDFKNFVERVMLYAKDSIVDYYVNKKNLFGSIEENTLLVESLNEILNRLKDATNPLVIVQIYILKYMNNISREIKGVDFIENEKNITKNNNDDEKKIISQEIKITEKNEKSDVINDTENIQKNNTEIEKTCKNGQISGKIHVNLQNKSIRINNSLATANINYKRELTQIWHNLNKFFVDEKYSKIAQLLSDVVPMVVGSDYAIMTTVSSGLIENIYSNLVLVEEFIGNIYRHLAIVILTNDEFEQIKNKYIDDKKKNIVYQIQEECGKLVEEENLISQAIDLFGTDIVEIE